MTYCLSLLCREGIVFLSDSRSSAGVDNITIQPKMRVYAGKGDRLEMKYRARLEDGDEYFREIQMKWGDGVIRLVKTMPRMRFPGVTDEPGAHQS